MKYCQKTTHAANCGGRVTHGDWCCHHCDSPYRRRHDTIIVSLRDRSKPTLLSELARFGVQLLPYGRSRNLCSGFGETIKEWKCEKLTASGWFVCKQHGKQMLKAGKSPRYAREHIGAVFSRWLRTTRERLRRRNNP